MNTTMHTEERIAEAWKQHRTGNHAQAITLLKDIVAKNPDHVDAQYGLGLALRASGDKSAAIAAFQHTLKLARKALDAVKFESQVEGHHGANNLGTYEDDRYMMLSRMINQRLQEMGATSQG